MKTADDREEVLFREAIQRASGPEREAFLNQACAGNAALRARLEALLQAHESPDPFLEPPAGDLAGQALPLPASDLTLDLAGSRIGRYKLREQIGEGGCGVVYLAEQEEPVKRRVALKVIRPGMDANRCWLASALLYAEENFRTVKGHESIKVVLASIEAEHATISLS